MYELRYSNQFKRQYKKLRCSGRKRIVNELSAVVSLLAKGAVLPDKYHNHKLTGDLKNCWECHIAPDWLLFYKIYGDIVVLELVAMGSHGVLFC